MDFQRLLLLTTIRVCDHLCLVRLGLPPRVAGDLHLVVFVQCLAQRHFLEDRASLLGLFGSIHQKCNSLVEGAQAFGTIIHVCVFADADRGSIALLGGEVVGGFRYLPIHHVLVIDVVLVPRREASGASRRGLWCRRLLHLPRKPLIGKFLLLHAERRRSVVAGCGHGQVAQIGIELDLIGAQVEQADIFQIRLLKS